MRTLLFVVQKEFIQIFKNRTILPLIFVAPIAQLIILSFAATSEVTGVRTAVVDRDGSQSSRRLAAKVAQSDRFVMLDPPGSPRAADALLESGEADVILVIESGFERDFYREGEAEVQVLVDAINGQQATVGAGYLNAIIRDFNAEWRGELGALATRRVGGGAAAAPALAVTTSMWYNPLLDYQDFMVPGILGELVVILITMLSAMNVVREREIGTIEQVNVTPIAKWQFILGKMIPFLAVGLWLITVGLIAGKVVFDIPMRGSLALVFGYTALCLPVALGLGLLISNLSDTQQQAMFITFFFVIVFVLMCGLFTPIASMPEWAQALTLPNPLAHFVAVMRGVLLKGAGFSDLAPHFYWTAGLAVGFNALAVATYRKVA